MLLSASCDGSGCSASGRRCRWSRGDGRRICRTAGWWRRWLRAGSENDADIAGDVADCGRGHESHCRCSIPTTAPAVGPSSSTAPPGPATDLRACTNYFRFDPELGHIAATQQPTRTRWLGHPWLVDPWHVYSACMVLTKSTNPNCVAHPLNCKLLLRYRCQSSSSAGRKMQG